MTRAIIATGLVGVVLGAVASLIPAPAVAGVGINKHINFQGKLVNTDGTNVTNGTYNIEFKMYTGGDGCVPGGSVASPCGGTNIWTEDWLRNNSQGVVVQDGLFQLDLGSITSLPATWNNDTVWLSINLGNTNATCTDMTSGQCHGDGEMLPFIRFTAAPYAMNSDLLDGLGASAFAQLSPGSAQSGFLNVTGNVTSGATVSGTTVAASTGLQAPLLDTASAVTLNIGTATASGVTIGRTSTPFLIQGNGSSDFTVTASGKTTTVGFTTPTQNTTLNFPASGTAGTYTICTSDAASCSSTYATSSGGSGYLTKDAPDTSTFAVTASNYLYGFRNSSSAVASGVLKLDNNTNTGNALYVTSAGNPGSGSALIVANQTNGSPSGNLLDLQKSAASEFSVDYNGNVSQNGGSSTTDTINGQRISSAANFTGTVTAATSVLAPLVDTASGVPLAVGTNNATAINLNQNTTVATGKTFTANGTTSINTSGSATTTIGNTSGGNVSVESAGTVGIEDGTTGTGVTLGNTTSNPSVSLSGSGTFSTTTGSNNLNGNTTVASNKSFTADGLATFQDATNSTTAFQIQTAGGANILTANTSDSLLTSAANFESTGYFDNGIGGIGQFGNLVQRSEQFDQAAWTKNLAGTAATANTAVAPDGQTTADTIHTTTNGGNLTQTVSGGNNTYTFSVWLKTAASTQNVDLRIDSDGTPGTGTAKTVTATTTWQRFFVTQTFTSGVGNVTPTIFPGTASGTDSQTVYAWGGQLVQAGNPEVYVRTTGAAVAASAGVVSNGGLFASSANATDIPIIVQGDPGQSVDLMQTQNSGGTPLFKVSAVGAVTSVGLNAGTGLIQGTGGVTVTGTVQVNASGAGATTIGNASSGALTVAAGANSTINIGTNSLAITSSNFNVSTGGVLNVVGGAAGFQIGGAAASGHYLRGNGTSYVDGTIQSGDLPSLVGTYLVNTPTATSDNTVNPGANNAVALTVRGSSNGANPDILDVRDSGNVLQGYFDSVGRLNVSQLVQPTSGNSIDLGVTGTRFRTGYFSTSVSAPSFTGAGAVGVTSGSGSALTITGDAASTWSTTTGNLTVDAAGALNLGTTSATSLSIGKTTTTATVNGTLAIGASAGSGAMLNNGSTVNTAYTMSNLATGGWDAGGASATVDIYTYIAANQTTAGQTLTPSNPTANTTYGRVVYVSNIGSVSFTMLGTTINPGTTATLVWTHANGGDKWTFAGADGSSILNQNSTTQTANFQISGTGSAATLQGTTSVLTPTLDTASGVALNIGTSGGPTTTQINLNQSVSVGSGKNLTFAGGASNFDQSASSGTFKTGSGAVSLNGATTVSTATNSAVALTVKGTTGTAADVLDIYNSAGTPTLQDFFDSNGSLNVGQVIQPTSNNTIDLGLSGTKFRTGYFGTSVSSPSYTGAGAVSLTSASGSALTITGDAASTWSTTTGNLTVDSAATLQLGTSNATGVSIGKSTTTATVNGTLKVGASAGAGALLNNGATTNTELRLTDFATGGSIGSAASTVDIYTYISVVQTTGSQTLTIPSPTASTTYGKLLYLSNIGNVSFTLLGTTISAGTTATLVWSHANGGDKWTFAGADGSSILNQNAATQTANFLISGTGQANTSLLTALLDTQSGTTTLNVGTNNATSGINLNQTVTIASGKNLNFAGGASNFDQHLSSGTFQTGTGNVSLNGVTTVTGTGANELAVTGAPTNSATSSLVQLGNAIATGNSASNGGTYLGLNEPSSGAGSAADFLNFQVNGAYKLKVTNAGLLDAVGGFAVNGTSGSTLGACGAGQYVSSFQSSGGIVVGGSCTLLPGGGGTGFLAKNQTATESSSGSVAGDFYDFTNTNTGSSANVLTLTNDGSNNTLKVTTAVNPGSGNAILFVSNTNATPSGNLLDLQSGTSPTSKFSVDASGNVTAAGTYNTNTFTSSHLQFGAASTATIEPAAGQALTITGHATSTWSTDAGNLNIQASGTNTLALDTAGAGTVTVGNANAATVNVGTNSSAHTIGIGTGGSGAQAVTIGTSATSSNTVNIDSGTGSGGISIGTAATAHDIKIGTSGTAAQTITEGSNNASSVISMIGGAAKQTIANAGDTVQTTANSTTGFQIQNANGNDNLFLADTTNGNLLTNSSFETNASGWSGDGSGSIAGGDTTTALYGNASGKITTGTTSSSGAKYAYTMTNTQVYGFSFWAVRTTGSDFTVRFGRSDNGSAESNCSTGTVTTTWTRFTCTFTAGAQSGTPYLYITDNDTTNRSFFIDGVQLELTSVTAYREGNLQFNGTVTDPVTFKNVNNVASALDVQNSSGTSQLTVDTVNSKVTAGGTLQLGASAGTGALVNNGATTNTELRLGDFSGGGSIGSAASTVDIYTYISVGQTSTGQTLTINSPTASGTYGKLVYLSNIGSASFTLLGTTISAGTTATLIWTHANGGDKWTFAGADGSSILNQNASTQTANFLISGTGTANTSFLTQLLDTPSGTTTLDIGTNNATAGIVIHQDETHSANKSIIFSAGTGGFDQHSSSGTFQSGTGAVSLNGDTTVANGKTLNIGSTAGHSALVNNGATTNTEDALGNFNYSGSGNTGSIGTNTATVDIYTYISIAQTTASQTLTIPSPTASTAYGKLLYISNIGTASFTMLGTTISTGTTATLVWANKNGGAAWTFAGADGSSILNQNATTQTANFQISGTGSAATLVGTTSVTSPLFDTISATQLNLGTSTANAVSIGKSTTTTTINGTAEVGTHATAGTGALLNNGSTTNSVDTLTDCAANCTLSQTAIDNYTYIAQPQTTTGKTITIPNPTASTTYGKIIYLTNTGTTSFALLSTNLSAGSTASLIWANVNGTGTWTFAGADANGLQSAYNNSGTTDPQIQLSNTNGGIKIRDAASSTIGNLLQIADSAGTTKYLQVTSAASTFGGNLAFTSTGGAGTRTISVATQTASNTAGDALSVSAATGNGSGAGGQLSVAGGVGGATGDGGAVVVVGGAGGGGNHNGGAATVQGGAATGTGTGGTASLIGGATAGATTGSAGGAVAVTGTAGATGSGATSGGAGGGVSVTSGAGGAGTGTNSAGTAAGNIVITAGNGGNATGNAASGNGGSITLTPGIAGTVVTGTAGTPGVVNIDTPVFTNTTDTVSSSPFNVSQAHVDQFSTDVITDAATTNATVNIPNPGNTSAGRTYFVASAAGNVPFYISMNSGALNIYITANTTAQIMWNGTAWTGSSADTSLQGVYNDTSASPASIVTTSSTKTVVLQAGSGFDSSKLFQIQNGTTADVLRVGTTSARTNYITNPGGELVPSASDWTAYGASSVVGQSTSPVWSGLGSVSVATPASATRGAQNKLSAALANSTTYSLSFYAKASGSNFSTLNVDYLYDGTNSDGTLPASCTAYSVVTTGWTRFTCFFTTSSSSHSKTSSNVIAFYQTDAPGGGRTFYIDGALLEQVTTTANPYGAGIAQLDALVTAPLSVQNTEDSTTELTVASAAGTSLLNVDSLNSKVQVGGATITNAGVETLTGNASSTTGDINVTSAAATAAGNSLSLVAGTGGSTSGTGGALNLNAGAAGGGGIGGAVNVNAGAAVGNNAGGAVNINSGAASGTSGSGGGAILLTAANGNGTSGSGGNITLQGGTGNGASTTGGSITLTPGQDSAGTPGVVNIDAPVFTNTTDTVSSSTLSISTAHVDQFSTDVITDTANTNATVSVPNPTNQSAGRTYYVASAAGNVPFFLSMNSGGNALTIYITANSTAQLIWNGTAWTASSADTSLQGVYNDTQTSPAVIVTSSATKNILFQAGSGDDNSSLFAVEGSSGSSVLQVDTTNTAGGTNLAVNGGAESGTNTSTPPTSWAAAPAGGTVTWDNTAAEVASGTGSAKVTTTTTTVTGAKNNLGAALTNGLTYLVSFSIKGSGTVIPNSNVQVTYLYNGTSADTTNCTAFTAQTISTSAWTKYTCSWTVGTAGTSSAALEIVNNNTTAYTFFVDNLSIVQQNSAGTQDVSDLHVGGPLSQGLTLLTLDTYAGTPWTSNANTTLLGSMYFDTTAGELKCYDTAGWGSCGPVPNQTITLTPEYQGAVLNGSLNASNNGTMTANLCANSGTLTGGSAIQPDASLCGSNQIFNYYKWTTTQSTSQLFDIFVRYTLPTTFKSFSGNITMTARTSSTTNGVVTGYLYQNDGTLCNNPGGTPPGTDLTTSGGANTWSTTTISQGTCTFNSGDTIMFRVNVSSKSSALVYASNIVFTFTGK